MADRAMSQNDAAWEALFERYGIAEQIEARGRFVISAARIKEYREPRLMAKFDHSVNLPRLFLDSDLAILPISRGEYVISHFAAYHPFEPCVSSFVRASLPAHLQSLDAGAIPSEAIAVNCALAAGILSDFLGEETLYPTVSGRMGSGSFSFSIRNTHTRTDELVEVNNAQIEIDAALEGRNSLCLLEAKRDLAEDFLVRQLYYPYRTWMGRVAKSVRPVFLVYSNGIFSLREYAFTDPGAYHSLVLVRQKSYAIEETAIGREELIAVLRDTAVEPEPGIPFPQADDFHRVVNVCELLAAREMSREEVTAEYAFDTRQTNYYTDAARYLGLVEKRRDGRRPVYSLSETGRGILRLGYRQRQLALCGRILRHRPFREVLHAALAAGRIPDRRAIVGIMLAEPLYGVGSPSTYERRASTVAGWVHWMLSLIETAGA